MWIKTQDGDLLNSDKVYRFYADEENNVYAQIEVGERWSDLIIGKYKTAERAKATLNTIFTDLDDEEITFVMPPEEVTV